MICDCGAFIPYGLLLPFTTRNLLPGPYAVPALDVKLGQTPHAISLRDEALDLRREMQMAAYCQSEGVRLLGPNCLGLINTENRMNASFAGAMPKPDP